MRNASRLLLAAAMAATAEPWTNTHPIVRPPLPARSGMARRGKPTQSQIRRAARKRRNIRARSPMARKG